jgi:hypothetical protein
MTNEAEDPPDGGEIEIDDIDVIETGAPGPAAKQARGPALAGDELPAGVPPRFRLRTPPWWVLALAGVLLLFAILRTIVWNADRERVEETCIGDIGGAAVHLGRGDLDLAERSIAWATPECRAAHAARVGELQREIAAKKLEAKTKVDSDAREAAAARELEAVASFPATAVELRKRLQQGAAHVERNDLEKAAPLVVPCRSTLDRAKGTSVERTAEWIALNGQCEQLREKVKPYMDQVQAELAEAQRQLKAEAEQDRRDGVKRTRDGYVASTSLDKVERAVKYLAASDKEGFNLFVHGDPEVLLLKAGVRVSEIERAGIRRDYVRVRVRGTLTEFWTVTEALQDP